MIKISFMTGTKEIINLEVNERKVIYYDKIWKTGVQFMPKDPQFVIRLLSARNRIPVSNQIIQWINEANSGKNLEEYNAAKTDEEIIEIVRKDGLAKGLIEVKI